MQVLDGIGTNDTITGSNTARTWTITGANAGIVDGIVFIGAEELIGGTASDELAGSAVTRTWSITGLNAGAVDSMIFV